jgi:hypothetical protein
VHALVEQCTTNPSSVAGLGLVLGFVLLLPYILLGLSRMLQMGGTIGGETEKPL